MATTQDCVQLLYEETPRYEAAPSSAPYRVSTVARFFPLQSFGWNANPAGLDRSDEVRGIEGDPPQLVDGYAPAGAYSQRAYVNDLIFLLGLAGFAGVVTAGAGGGTNEVQSITTTGTPTGGTFTLTFTLPGTTVTQTTGPIVFNAAASVIQAALEALPAIGVGNVVCAGGPLPTATSVTFQGQLGSRDITALGHTDSLTGGASPAVVVATTTPGVAGSVSDPDGGTVPVGASRWVFLPRSGATAKTGQFTAAYADEGTWVRGQGVGLSRLGMTAAGAVTADLMGLVFGRLLTDPNLTPSFDTLAIPNLRQGDFLQENWLAGSGSADDFSFEVANTLEPYRGLNASFFPREMQQGAQRVQVTGTRPARTLSNADIDALVAMTTFAAKGRWRSSKVIGATTYPYQMWVDMPSCQYIGGGADELTNARRFGGSYNWKAAYDEAAGYHTKITLVGSITAVSDVGN